MSAAPAWPWLADSPLVLASGSAARAALLRSAGVPIEIARPKIDERAIEAPLRAAGLVAADRALALAVAKALAASQAKPGALVLGSDQTLEAAGHPGTRASGLAEAKGFLGALAGRAHRLHSAAALARDGALLFCCVESATLVMRALSDADLDAYLAAAPEAALSAVGGYHIEELGVNLFERTDGDRAVIMGLPVLPILSFLRRIGAAA